LNIRYDGERCYLVMALGVTYNKLIKLEESQGKVPRKLKKKSFYKNSIYFGLVVLS
jgi:hypothetical protein